MSRVDHADLFSPASGSPEDTIRGYAALAPLAVRMRPRTIDDVRGQAAVLRQGSPLRRLVAGSAGAVGPMSAILWGPPGTGKTTLAHLVATAAGRRFVELSAVTAGVKDVREVIATAKRERDLYGRHTVLFLDEIHRFTRSQQDALLPHVESGLVTLIGATTESPWATVNRPLLSRCTVLELKALDDAALDQLADRGLRLLGRELDADARRMIVGSAGGDGRRLLTGIEMAADLAATDVIDGATMTAALGAGIGTVVDA